MLRKDDEPRLANRLHRVTLHAQTLDSMQRGGLPIFYFGARAEAAKHEKGLSGEVAVYREGTLRESYCEPWDIQLEMIAEENEKMAKQDPSWRIVAPPNLATPIEVAHKVYKQYGFNVLPLYTRVGDGSLVAGFNPRGGAVVDDWLPGERHNGIGVLPLAVRALDVEY